MIRTTMAVFTLKHGRRAGVSLLEVMFSLGVATIGLLGVASLVSVAGVRIGNAAKMDAASAYANEALGVFGVRDFARDDYILADGSRLPKVAISGIPIARQARRPIPLCIDPLGVAGPMTANGASQLVGGFPAIGDPAFSIPRVMRASLAARGANQAEQIRNRRLVAESLFVSRNDLIFERPKDRTIPAKLLRSEQGIPQYDGRFSWFATMSPASLVSNLYTLSIVVVHGRALDASQENDVGFPVRFLGGSGTQVGGVVLRGVGDTKIADDSWLMLRHGGSMRVGWYLVVSGGDVLTAEDVAGSSLLLLGDEGGRMVELRGADWPIPVDAAQVNTQAAFVKGVIQVVERTVMMKN